MTGLVGQNGLLLKAVSAALDVWDASSSGSGIALSNGGRTATRSAGGNNVAVAVAAAKTSGKLYWEIQINTVANFMYVGLIRVGSSFSATGTNDLGSVTGTISYANDAHKYVNGTYSTYGATFTTGDVIGVAADISTGNIWFAKNNAWQASGDPASGANPAGAITSLSSGMRPAVSVGTSTNYGGVVTSRFTSSQQSYAPPSGFASFA